MASPFLQLWGRGSFAIPNGVSTKPRAPAATYRREGHRRVGAQASQTQTSSAARRARSEPPYRAGVTSPTATACRQGRSIAWPVPSSTTIWPGPFVDRQSRSGSDGIHLYARVRFISNRDRNLRTTKHGEASKPSVQERSMRCCLGALADRYSHTLRTSTLRNSSGSSGTSWTTASRTTTAPCDVVTDAVMEKKPDLDR